MIHLYVYCIIYTVSQKLCTSPASCCHLRTVEKWRKVEATTRSFHLYMTSSSLGERGSSRKIPWISFGTQTMLTLPSFAVGNTNLHEFSSQKCVCVFFSQGELSLCILHIFIVWLHTCIQITTKWVNFQPLRPIVWYFGIEEIDPSQIEMFDRCGVYLTSGAG